MCDRIILSERFLEAKGFRYGLTSTEEDMFGSVRINMPCAGPEDGWVHDGSDFSIKIVFPDGTNSGSICIDDLKFDRNMIFNFTGCMYLDEFVRICSVFDDTHINNFISNVLTEDLDDFQNDADNEKYVMILKGLNDFKEQLEKSNVKNWFLNV